MITLNEIQTAMDECSLGLSDGLKALRDELVRLNSPNTATLIAPVDGYLHEMDLLRRQEIELIGNGKITDGRHDP